MKKIINYIFAAVVAFGILAGFYLALWLGYILGFDM